MKNIRPSITKYSSSNEGRDKIDWVQDHMPLLNHLYNEFLETRPFEGLKISVSVHLEAKTAYMCQVFAAGGAEVFVTGSNTLSTQDDIAAGLDSYSDHIHVYAIHGVDDETYNKHLEYVLECCPDIIIDDGGDLVHMLHEVHPEYACNVIGGCEETTTGILRLQSRYHKGKLKFPMMAINDADCKHLFDNRYGTGQSVWDSIMRNTNLIVAGKTVVVAGYGWCSKGIAMRAKALGASVIVTEVDPVKALEAVMDGYRVRTMDKASFIGDIFITATGCNDVITYQHMLNMQNKAIVCNAGHFNVEVDMKTLEENASYKRLVRPNVYRYLLENNKEIDVIAEGKLVNIAAADGHPAEIMDMSFACQLLGAKYLVDTSKDEDIAVRLIEFPKYLDKQIAELKLKTLGIDIDHLTDNQIEYMYGNQY